MELYIVDAFTHHIFKGNQAGVVLIEGEFPKPAVMQQIAAELKHSETAFVKTTGKDSFTIRYFTPVSEVDLCGHATLSAFFVLREEKHLDPGSYTARTGAGDLNILVEADSIWITMAKGRVLKKLSAQESKEVYKAYGLSLEDQPAGLEPWIVNTGLSDILLPVDSKKKLDHALQNKTEVMALSKRYGVVGIHMFFWTGKPEITAACRNFAPLFGIDEEAATGTSNGALTYYLSQKGLISAGDENTFLQGESMGEPSVIKSRVGKDKTIQIGGDAVISIRGTVNL